LTNQPIPEQQSHRQESERHFGCLQLFGSRYPVSFWKCTNLMSTLGPDADLNKVANFKHLCIFSYLHPSRGKNSLDITNVIDKITKSYGVSAVENMVSQEVSKYKINAEKQIMQNPSDDQKTKNEKYTFENYEVFAIDVLITTGDGK
jgi:hypothetical protein